MDKYLHEDQYYIDLYDLLTIEDCISMYRGIRENFEKNWGTEKFKKFTKEKFDAEGHRAANFAVHVTKVAERYRRKVEVIQGWKTRDRRNQEKYDETMPPTGIICKDCSSPTKVIFKTLLDTQNENPEVLFMFECAKCKKRQALYENGRKWTRDSPRCPKCNSELSEKFRSTKKSLTTIYACKKCSYQKKEVDDFKKSEKDTKAKEAGKNKLLSEFRKEYCLDDIKGPELIRSLDQFSVLMKKVDSRQKMESDPAFQKSKQLKKLTFANLEKLLETALEKGEFKGLKFGKPELGKYVIVEFSVNDAKDERQEYESQKTLKKLIKGTLVETNWRLMSDSIQYRLGILIGRLKAYERDEELLELVKSEK